MRGCWSGFVYGSSAQHFADAYAQAQQVGTSEIPFLKGYYVKAQGLAFAAGHPHAGSGVGVQDGAGLHRAGIGGRVRKHAQ